MHLLGLWWVWMAAALVFGILELLIPGFIFLGFAFGAAAVGIVLFLPISAGATALLAVFAIFSLVSWIVLKRLFKGPAGQRRIIREDINE